MEVKSEKYTKLIKLAQKFDACQNDLLHYQKREIFDHWNTSNSDMMDDDSSILNIKKISKKTKRAKSCLVRCTNKPNSKTHVNKISPPKKKTSITKLKSVNNFDQMSKYALKSGIILKGKYEDNFPLYRDKSKKWNSSVYVRSPRSGYLSNNKDSNTDNGNVEKKTKLNKTATTLRSAGTKEEKCKASLPVETQEENKKKRKSKRKNNTLTTKTDGTGLTKSPRRRKKHSKKSRSKENKEELKKREGKEHHFVKRKKRSCLKKKRKIRLKKICSLHNVNCNDSVDSAGSAISADTLDSGHMLKKEKNELLVSLRERIQQWTPSTITGRGISARTYRKHKHFTFNINKESSRKRIFRPPNDCNSHSSEFNKKENEQIKQELLASNKQPDINKQLDINKANIKHNHKSEDIKHRSYKPTTCKNITNVENKSIRNDPLQKKKEAVQWSSDTFPENGTYPLICDMGDTCDFITNSTIPEVKNNTSLGVEKQKSFKQLDVQTFKQLLKALNESAFLTITKKRQHKKSKRKNKRISRKTKATKNNVKQGEEHK